MWVLGGDRYCWVGGGFTASGGRESSVDRVVVVHFLFLDLCSFPFRFSPLLSFVVQSR